jgi:ribonuclease J
MIALTRPKFFLPVHGEHRMLVKHSQTAQSMGIPAENMVIIDNGDVVSLSQESIRVVDRVPSGIELVDSSRIGVVKDDVLKERQRLAEDGVVTIATAIGWNGKLEMEPSLHLRGVVSTIEPHLLQKWVAETLEDTLSDRWSNFAQTNDDGQVDVDWSGLKNHLERELQRMLRRELRQQPLLVFLMQTPKQPPVKSNSPKTGRRRTRSTAKVAS